MRMLLMVLFGYMVYRQYRAFRELEAVLDAEIARLNAVRALMAAVDSEVGGSGEKGVHQDGSAI